MCIYWRCANQDCRRVLRINCLRDCKDELRDMDCTLMYFVCIDCDKLIGDYDMRAGAEVQCMDFPDEEDLAQRLAFAKSQEPQPRVTTLSEVS